MSDESRSRLVEHLTAIRPGDVDGPERLDPASAATYATMGRM